MHASRCMDDIDARQTRVELVILVCHLHTHAYSQEGKRRVFWDVSSKQGIQLEVTGEKLMIVKIVEQTSMWVPGQGSSATVGTPQHSRGHNAEDTGAKGKLKHCGCTSSSQSQR